MSDITRRLRKALGERILVIDGAWGTQIQERKLDEADFRAARFTDHPVLLKGNNDLLNLVRPDIIRDIHDAYFSAGADIGSTNTFSATTIAQADYHLESVAAEIAYEGARIARAAADDWTRKTPGKPRYVAGAIGPTNKTLSISPKVADPAYRDVTFAQVTAAYREQAEAMLRGGVDILLIETVFDTLNAKAAIYAVEEARERTGIDAAVVISGTITDRSGRTLSGQTPEAFWNSVRHARPLAVGLNCALGAAQMRPFIAELARVADVAIIAYPNAGLPNAMGEYDETPDQTAGHLCSWARDGLVNIVGGCCGTTPAHISAIASWVCEEAPRSPPAATPRLKLSGLEPYTAAA